MSRPGYRRPSWWQRAIGNRLAPVLGRRIVATLQVPGHRTGRVRTSFRELPDPADHPTSRLVTARR